MSVRWTMVVWSLMLGAGCLDMTPYQAIGAGGILDGAPTESDGGQEAALEAGDAGGDDAEDASPADGADTGATDDADAGDGP